MPESGLEVEPAKMRVDKGKIQMSRYGYQNSDKMAWRFPLWIALPILSATLAVSQQKPPNIVMLLSDDHRWDMLGILEKNIIQTPNLDALAKEGVLFENAYVTTSICWASRTTFATGHHQSVHGVGKGGGNTAISTAQVAQTYYALLRKAGYQTAMIGKYGIKGLKESDFDFWAGKDDSLGYEVFGGNGKIISYRDNYSADKAIEFLKTTSTAKPFNLNVSFKAPHAQDGDNRVFITDPAYNDYYKNDVIPTPVTADPAFFSAQPGFIRNSLGRSRWMGRYNTPELFQDMAKKHHRLITQMDAAVGRIVKHLKDMGAYENTVIFFAGDNGFFVGERGLADKWLPYEHSIRVPLIITDPRQPMTHRGVRRSQIALNLDVAPTFLEYAGLPIPSHMQGTSLIPLIKNEAKTWRKEFFYEHLVKIVQNIPKSRAVVGERHKYIVYFDQSPPYEELFDFINDPFETKNLLKDAAYNAVLDSLKGRLNVLQPAAEISKAMPYLTKALIYGCMTPGTKGYNAAANVHVQESCQSSAALERPWSAKKVLISDASITIPYESAHTLSIADITGRIVFSATGEGRKEYSLSVLQKAGVYTVQITNPLVPAMQIKRLIVVPSS